LYTQLVLTSNGDGCCSSTFSR